MRILFSDGHILPVKQTELDQTPKLGTLFWPCVAISLVHVVDAIGYAVQGMQNISVTVYFRSHYYDCLTNV